MLKDLEVDGRRVTYLESGIKSSRTLVWLHGLGGDHRGLADCARLFPDYHVILPDLPGYGLSDALTSRHTLESYADFLESFFRQLSLEDLVLVGHSFGAAIAAVYVRQYPKLIRSLVLLNPILVNPTNLSSRVGGYFTSLVSLFPSSLSHYLLSNKVTVFLTDQTVLTAKEKVIRRRILDEDYQNYIRADGRALMESVRTLKGRTLASYEPLQFDSCLIVGGDNDKLLSPQKMRQLAGLIPKAKTVLVPGGHLLPLEDPRQVARVIRSFI